MFWRLFRSGSTNRTCRNHSSKVQCVVRAGNTGRKSRPYWQRRGWKYRDGVYVGYYRTLEGEWAGRIEEKGSENSFLIVGPPKCLHDHPKWHCFDHLGNHTFRVHYYGNPDVDEGILAMEQMIHQAFLKSGESSKKHRLSSAPAWSAPGVIRHPGVIRAQTRTSSKAEEVSGIIRLLQDQEKKEFQSVRSLASVDDLLSHYLNPPRTKAYPSFDKTSLLLDFTPRSRHDPTGLDYLKILGIRGEEDE